MMARALVHILRTGAGLTEVDATVGLGPADAAEIERLVRDNLADAGELLRHESPTTIQPSVFGRRLRSGRFAVTRVLPAPAGGQAGKPEAISLVMPAQAYIAAVGSLLSIAFDERFWRIARLAVAKGLDLPESACAISPKDPRVLRAFDTWLAARRRAGIAVLPPDDGPGILAMIAALEGEDCLECRWAIGALALEDAVDVCTLAPSARIASTRSIVQAAAGGSWNSPEMQHALWHLDAAPAGANPRFPRLRSLVSSVRVENARRASADAPGVGALARPSQPNLLLGVCGAVAILAAAAIVLRSGSESEDPAADARPAARAGPATDAPAVVSVPVRAPDLDSIARPSSAPTAPDADGDGVVNDIDCDPADPNRGLLQVFFRDFDGDGAGDPDQLKSMRACVPADASAPDGYSRRSDDLCDENPALTTNGGCPCHWAGPVVDLDGNGELDCLGDLDHDGKRLADDPEDDRYRLCVEIAEYFGRARRELAAASTFLNEMDERARAAARQRDAKGAELRALERALIEPHLVQVRDSIRTGLREVYVARTLCVFGDEAFVPRSRLDPTQAAPDILPVVTEEQLGQLRMFIEDLDRVTDRYVRAYARYIHAGRPQRLVREDLMNEVLGRWTSDRIGPADSLQAMRWVAGLVTLDDEALEREIRRVDDQLLKGRAARLGK